MSRRRFPGPRSGALWLLLPFVLALVLRPVLVNLQNAAGNMPAKKTVLSLQGPAAQALSAGHQALKKIKQTFRAKYVLAPAPETFPSPFLGATCVSPPIQPRLSPKGPLSLRL